MPNQSIDPTGEDVVVFYSGEGVVRGVPARDLTGGDLARTAYERAHSEIPWEVRDDDGNAPPLPKRATAAQLAKLADELVASGVYRRTKPDSAPAIDTSTNEPAAPAETPEA